VSEDMEEYFEYLDVLRSSGRTNMFGAGPYLQEKFGLNENDARITVLAWMRTFDERHPPKDAGV